MSNTRFEFTPIEDLTRPRSGATVTTDSWWVVDPELGAAFSRSGRPQCNRSRHVAELVMAKAPRLYGGLALEHIPVAYWDRT